MGRFSFKFRFLFFIFLFNVAVIGLFLLISSQSLKLIFETKMDLAKSAAESMIDKIDRNLFERYGDVQAFAQSEPARSLNRKRIEAFMSDMVAAYAPIYDAMIVTDKNGIVVAANHVDKSGKPTRLAELVGKNLSKESWFQNIINGKVKAGAAHVEDLHIDKEIASLLGDSGRYMNFSAPIMHGSEIVGAWTNRMSWTDVVGAIVKEETKKLKNERLTEIQVTITNSGGLVLLNTTHPESELQNTDPSIARFATRLTAGSVTRLTKAADASNQIQVISPSRGYSSYPGIGWITTLGVPESDKFIELNRSLVIFALIALMMGNVLCYLWARKMSLGFEQVVNAITKESRALESLSSEVQSSSQSLASSATQQASAIETTVSSNDEVNAMLNETNRQSERSLATSEEGRKSSLQGQQVVTELIAAMNDIQSSNEKLNRLVKLISEIKEKTAVINDIVSETRLLSFNASIEAARAGTQGKGFAVVAEEVGKLASMSGKAADQIQQLLESSTIEVATVVKSTQEKISTGKSISAQCESAFVGMSGSLGNIESSVQSIVSATREQQVGVKQTQAAMYEMERTTQINAQGAEKLSTTAQSLAAAAGGLGRSLSQLRSLVFGLSKSPAEKPKQTKTVSRKSSAQGSPPVG